MRFVLDENNNHHPDDEVQSGQAYWYHVACFLRLRPEIGWLRCGDALPGFNRLFNLDQAKIKYQIP